MCICLLSCALIVELILWLHTIETLLTTLAAVCYTLLCYFELCIMVCVLIFGSFITHYSLLWVVNYIDLQYFPHLSACDM